MLLFVLIPQAVWAGGMQGPNPTPPVVSLAPPPEIPPLSSGALWLFQTYISPVDGPRSPSYPTGSAYSKQVFAEEGFFMGLWMTADRLVHEADRPLGPSLKLHNTWRFYDPPSANRYWWKPTP